jgi:NAD(P)-dependent dehydrogenase (short-subunit alcohol dehydrogenase family)
LRPRVGRASAERFAEEGATVIVADLSEAEPFASSAIAFRALDVTAEAGRRALVDEVVAEHGRVDVLMNNAGAVGSYEPLDTIAMEDWHRIVALNQTGPFLGMRSASTPCTRALSTRR